MAQTFGKNAIEKDIYNTIAAYIETKISGKVYYPDCRPHDSKVEDAVIVVSTATAEQIQEGRAKVNIYVADKTVGGRKVPNIERLRAIEPLDSEIVKLLNNTLDDYDWGLSRYTDTLAAQETAEHFININLGFSHKTF